ncbi:MAG: hypothetical protein IPL46_18790 [Saprospiraceae bacterium]|nr:hypothetical protein [Saprospiraceae bacterium]
MKTRHFLNLTHTVVIVLLTACSICFAAFSGSQERSDLVVSSNLLTENGAQSVNKKYMVYKLYKERIKESVEKPHGLDLFEEFKKLYHKHNVKVIGEWRSADDPKEYYFMLAYYDEDHYRNFVNIMKENDKYQEMSKILAADRESIEVKTLLNVH